MGVCSFPIYLTEEPATLYLLTNAISGFPLTAATGTTIAVGTTGIANHGTGWTGVFIIIQGQRVAVVINSITTNFRCSRIDRSNVVIAIEFSAINAIAAARVSITVPVGIGA